jgi:hypothetical protein
LAYAVAFVGKALLEEPQEAAIPVAGPTVDDQEVLAAVDFLIRQRGLFRDPELSLDRRARRALLLTRPISGDGEPGFGAECIAVCEWRSGSSGQAVVGKDRSDVDGDYDLGGVSDHVEL